MNRPQTGDFHPGDDDTQEIPVVDGPSPYEIDDRSAPQSARRETSSGYTVLPSDAFAPTAAKRRRRVAAAATGGAVVVAMIVGGAIWIGADSDDDTAVPPTAVAAPPPVSGPSVSTPPVDADCPTQTTGNVTTGRDAGGQDSGVAVIKAFNYAYYMKRDAQAVSQFVLPAALATVIPSIDNLQKAIDALPERTSHCLTITDLGAGLHRVDLTQTEPAPSRDRVTFHQMIQTTNENGKWLIVSNTAVD